jgi:2-methylisocitrate lyase-like PEP mutase family enzyme
MVDLNRDTTPRREMEFVRERVGLVVPAVADVLTAVAAREAGAEVLMLSGAAVAASLGLPDVGVITISEITETARAVIDTSGLPLIVDGETGYGGLPALARLTEKLVGAGVTTVMIEDQEFKGESALNRPRLCKPDDMVERIRVAKDAGGGELKVMARTDILSADWPLSESLDRIRRYSDAGADWLIVLGARSHDEMAAIAEVINKQGDCNGFTGAFASATGYIPRVEEAAACGYGAIVVGLQYLATFTALLEIYRLTMRGETDKLRERQLSHSEFARILQTDRYRDLIER